MVEAYPHVANHSIRNRGTLGGNLCHNDPAFEMPLVVTLLGASMVARSARSSRTITAERFFKAPFVTDLAADEMLIEVRVPRLPAGHGYSFLEVSQRYGDRALIAAGCLLTIRYGTCRDVRIGFRNAVHNVFRIRRRKPRLRARRLRRPSSTRRPRRRQKTSPRPAICTPTRRTGATWRRR